MRYSPDRKEKTRQRILDEAARQFREQGISNTGLQPLMKTLGLTHGGFYAHFRSKDDLVESALQEAARQMDEETARVHETATPVATLISRYLSRTHRDSPGQGCALPTVSAELGQLGRPSESTDRIVQDRLTLIQEGLGKDRREERSFLILSAMVGGLVLARSVSDKTLSERILQSTRDQLLTLIDEERS
ncbi:TetR/AcrR family transcriptional regulator [Marinobacter bryozoorum]|uniref:TetR/AcrR family transcriptional regulator n=1 Tax=Marinobacter bryozoorum TaxID=256324 RepID=UPI002002B92D|nr:TetR/AcrR family transcriptional regulator [Marinobacter bryozoorum]MCK7542561.1 TetR/AcrR family transcriptional regulator [Marinobacter bryozoorum]